MAFKKFLLVMPVIALVFGFFCCDNLLKNDNLTEDKNFTVTFNLDGGNFNNDKSSIKITVKSGETIDNLPNPQKADNTFGGWFTGTNGLGNEFKTSTVVTSDITVFAKWMPTSKNNALTLPASTVADKATTGENNSRMYKFTGEDFTKIKEALPGSYLVVTYKASVNYAVGEIGWKSITEAGPVISGNGSNLKQEVSIDVKFLADVIGTDNFTIHMFNPSELLDVTLIAAPDDYVVKDNPKATAGATPIFIPVGHTIFGWGDLSKVDFKKITTAASGSLVFYFDDTTDTKSPFLKFGPKSGDPYMHYGISKDGVAVDGSDGWRALESAETRTITYKVADIKAAITAAKADFPTGIFNQLEIYNDASGKEGILLYIELKP